MRFRTLSLSALAVVAACGCKSGPVERLAEAPPVNFPAGWNMAKDDESGVSIGVPPGWAEGTGVAADIPVPGMSGGTDPSLNSDPNNVGGQMAAALGGAMASMASDRDKKERARLRANGVIINVTDGSKSSIAEQRTRFYVKRIKHDSPFGLEAAIAEEKNHLINEGAGADVTLPVGKAHRFEAQNDLKDGDHQTQISYVLADGSDTYLIRFISTNNPEIFKPFEANVAQSFRIKHPAK